MGGDEEEEESDEENPFASMETQEDREAAYIKDPKKTLRGFFEREGMCCKVCFFVCLFDFSTVI